MKLNVRDRQGVLHPLDALDGWRVMEVIRDWGLDIKAECGGACACATCHVYVDPEWIGRLAEPTEEEQDMLDGAFEIEATSRLSCQILMSDELDGLIVTLAPGSEADEKAA